MTVRGFFNNVSARNEQDLIESLIIESIQIKGIDVQYILREKINPDTLLGESSVSKFTNFYTIEMYLDLVTQYNGDGDMFTGYGMSFSDHAEFLVSSRRFKDELLPEDLVRPREGDLIYMPMSDTLWEISKVKQDHEYYQLGKSYTYRIVCNLFQYSDEEIETGYESDFNDLGTTTQVDEEGLKEVFGLKLGDVRDKTETLEEISDEVITFDPNNPFAY